jgi:UDP-2,3-diacylglucosamine pyrophosphatase LpxH
MTSQNKQTNKVLEWRSVQNLIKNSRIKKSILDKVYNIIQETPQVSQDEKK